MQQRPFGQSLQATLPTINRTGSVQDPDEKRSGGCHEHTAKDDSLFWDQYIKEADLYDKELVKSLGGDLDTLLIFAGLFSAVNTAFIIESYQDLKPDPAESGGTNALLRTLIQAVNNATVLDTLPINFIPPPHAVFVNAFFFASLCCSLLSAFGAVLAKQWLNEYERTGDNRVPHARARQRHAKYLGMQRYRSEMFMQGLGNILQVSLFLFFVALTNWLWGINRLIAAIAIVGVSVTFTFYCSTTIISIYDPTSPFSTRFSTLLRDLYRSAKSIGTCPATGMEEVEENDGMDRMDGQCIAWVYANATMFESVAGMARAAVHLPDDIRQDQGLDHMQVGPTLLRSILSSNAIPLGLTNGTLFSTVNTIQIAMTSWKGVPIFLAYDVVAQLHQALRLTISTDPSLSEAIVLTLQPLDLILSWTTARIRRPEREVLVRFIQLPSLTFEGKRAGLSLLWRYYFQYEIRLPGHDIRDTTNPNVVPPESSWVQEVADALIDTAVTEHVDDTDPERIAFRVAWVSAVKGNEQRSRKGLYGGGATVSPPLRQFFLETTIQNYLVRHIIKNPKDLMSGRALLVIFSYHLSSALHHPNAYNEMLCYGHEILGGELMEIAFKVAASASPFRPENIAPLYWWFHFREFHSIHQKWSASSAYISKQYLRFTVSNFLVEQLGPDPWLPAEHVTQTVAAIEAYVLSIQSDSPETYPAAPNLPQESQRHTLYNRPLKDIEDLLLSIREGSYRFQGSGSVGQQLWNCLSHVVRVLHPGEGIVTFIRPGGRLSSVNEGTLDWKEVDAVRILGLDSVPYELPPVTGKNFFGFGSY